MSRRIIITGQNGYIANRVKLYLDSKDCYDSSLVSLRENNWMDEDWSGVDTVLHTAGIARMEGSEESGIELFRNINVELSRKVAQKCALQNVKQIIFLSTFHVYGTERGFNTDCPITYDSEPCPVTPYAISKLEAENVLREELNNTNTRLAILRLPMVYGPMSKGNFRRLVLLSKHAPLIPETGNLRSIIYVDNVAELIRQISDKRIEGLFLPQDERPLSSYELISKLAKAQNRNTRRSSMLSLVVKPMCKRFVTLNKLFGNGFYDIHVSDFGINYRIMALDESLQNSI